MDFQQSSNKENNPNDDKTLKPVENVEDAEENKNERCVNLEELVPGFPEFEQLRNLVSNANSFVLNLEKCSDVFLDVISGIKQQLRKANVLVATLEKAQRETVLKMLNIKLLNASTQADPNASELERYENGSQSSTIEEILLFLIATEKHQSIHNYITLGDITTESEGMDTLKVILSQTSSLTNNTTMCSNKSVCESLSETKPDKCKKWPIPPGDSIIKNKLRRDYKHRNTMLFVMVIGLFINAFLCIMLMKALEKRDYLISLKRDIKLAFDNYEANCSNITSLENGMAKCTNISDSWQANMSSSQSCWFGCNYGYELSGARYLGCMRNGKWNATVPVCEETGCRTVKDRDCANLVRIGKAFASGIYLITQCGDFKQIEVYCDLTTDGGGWTAIQRRHDGSVNFTRPFEKFENNFGNARTSFWIGLKNMNLLSQTEPQMLMVVMTDWFYPKYHNTKAYAIYDKFVIGNFTTSYRAHISSFKISSFTFENAGNSLEEANGMQFTTSDADHDLYGMGNCADVMGSAWWHNNCTSANLNAVYTDKRAYSRHTIHWKTWRMLSSLKSVEMFIRPSKWEKERG